jgi:hypothetical protein
LYLVVVVVDAADAIDVAAHDGHVVVDVPMSHIIIITFFNDVAKAREIK